MNNKWKNIITKYQRPLLLLAIIIILTIMIPTTFLTGSNVKSILFSVSIYGIMVCGVIFPFLLAGIDISITGMAAVGGAICVQIIVHGGSTNGSVVIGILAGLGAGLLSGYIHGLILANFKIDAFLLTLATVQILYGIAQIITGNLVIACMEPKLFTTLGTGRFLGIPIPIYILAIFILTSYIILNKTTFGRKIYCVGGNRSAAALSGIKVKKVIIISYMMSGFAAAAAGIVLASMNQQAISTAATGYDVDVLASVVAGGVSLAGGEGTIQGAIFGAFLIAIVGNGLRLLGVPVAYHGIAKGLIIIGAVAVDMYIRYRNSGLHRRKLH